MKWVMKGDGDIDDMMERVVEEQSQTLYEHQETPHCPDKGSNNYYYSTLDITMIILQNTGCGRCWSIDGNWKITFPHCMFPVSIDFQGSLDYHTRMCVQVNQWGKKPFVLNIVC